MAILTAAGSGFVKYDEELLNLKGFREIGKYNEGSDYTISFTPFMPLKEDWESNVAGTWHISYDSSDDRDKDFQLIEEVLKQG